MKNKQWIISEIQIDSKNKFSVIHNLPNIFGLSLDNAVENWLVRTDNFTPKSLINYINSKNTEYQIYTIEEFKRLYKDKFDKLNKGYGNNYSGKSNKTDRGKRT